MIGKNDGQKDIGNLLGGPPSSRSLSVGQKKLALPHARPDDQRKQIRTKLRFRVAPFVFVTNSEQVFGGKHHHSLGICNFNRIDGLT